MSPSLQGPVGILKDLWDVHGDSADNKETCLQWFPRDSQQVPSGLIGMKLWDKGRFWLLCQPAMKTLAVLIWSVSQQWDQNSLTWQMFVERNTLFICQMESYVPALALPKTIVQFKWDCVYLKAFKSISHSKYKYKRWLVAMNLILTWRRKKRRGWRKRKEEGEKKGGRIGMFEICLLGVGRVLLAWQRHCRFFVLDTPSRGSWYFGECKLGR